MAFTQNPQGREKPCVISCRLSQEDYNEFDRLTEDPGKKQQTIEGLIIGWIKKQGASNEID